jgi:hypothetical protein
MYPVCIPVVKQALQVRPLGFGASACSRPSVLACSNSDHARFREKHDVMDKAAVAARPTSHFAVWDREAFAVYALNVFHV